MATNPMLEFRVKAKNWSDAKTQADATIATFIGMSGLQQQRRSYEMFDAEMVDVSSMREPGVLIPTTFTTTVRVMFEGN